MKRRLSSQRISPTAHYTGYVWIRNKESDPAFRTAQGAFLYWVIWLSRLTPWLEGWLLARHRLIDRALTTAIDRGEISQIVEIAAGLSPRGWQFRKRFGSRITYVETDLAAMIQHKRQILDGLGGETPHHYLHTVDVLAQNGANSLESLCSSLDPSRGIAIVCEGLLLYFDKPDVLDLWRRISVILKQFPRARYFADISPLIWPSTTPRFLFEGVLGGLVRGKVHRHYARVSDVADDLVRCGLTGEMLDPSLYADQLGVDPRAASHGCVIAAEVDH